MSGIVVGVDGSPHAQMALEWALNEAAIHGAALTALAVVVEPVTAEPVGPVPIRAGKGEYDAARLAASEAVEKANAGRTTPVPVTVRVVGGVPADVLVNAGADLLVVGSRGVGAFSRLFLGSVSTQVIHQATCPVVVVPHRQAEDERTTES